MTIHIFSRQNSSKHVQENTSHPFTITLNHNYLTLPAEASSHETVATFLTRNNITLDENDIIDPPLHTTLLPNTTITILPEKSYRIRTKDGEKTGATTLKTIDSILDEHNITTDPDDIIRPAREATIQNNDIITVVAVDIREEITTKTIPFTHEEKKDNAISWRKKIVEQKGIHGVKTFTYRVVSHDEKTIKRTLLREEITKNPVTEITTQGTLVKTGKTHTGLASWYKFTGTFSAANPWLPIGSFVRVINTDNGKSVIVRINDRGPFGKNRIVDLDSVAFTEIASLGTGIISVKMEEITN